MTEARRQPTNHDSEVVVTDDLAIVLEIWFKEYNANRPSGTTEWSARTQSSSPHIESMMKGTQPLKTICELTDVDPRRIYSILQRETFTTSLYLADHILTKIGLGHRLNNGSIRVVNRNMTKGIKKDENGKRVAKFASQEEWLEYLDQIGCRR